MVHDGQARKALIEPAVMRTDRSVPAANWIDPVLLHVAPLLVGLVNEQVNVPLSVVTPPMVERRFTTIGVLEL